MNDCVKDRIGETSEGTASSSWQNEEELCWYREQYRELCRQRDALRGELDRTRWALEQIQSSFFWRITKPLRWLLDKMKRVRFLELLLKGLKMLLTKGPRATWNRVRRKLREEKSTAVSRIAPE